MKKILVLNNYSLEAFCEPNPKFPGHLFYGVDFLHRRGDNIVLAGGKTSPLLRLIEKINLALHLHIPLGDLSQQWNSLPQVKAADLIYSPCDSVAQVLCYMRALGLIKIPIVCLAHHPLDFGWAHFMRRPFIKMVLRGTAAFPSLSRGVAEQINRMARNPQLSSALPWGPDLSFFPPYQPGRGGVVSAGRTGRDFLTLGRAATQTSTPVAIVCPARYVTAEFNRFSPNVTVLANDDEMHYSYDSLIDMYSNCSAIAIPMLHHVGLCGLSSLLDALAMGRAVIMTRNPLIDIDIEAEGIGFVIAPGDTDAWRKALQFIEDHPDETQAMGFRARRLAEQRYNSESFAERLLTIFDRAIAEPTSTA